MPVFSPLEGREENQKVYIWDRGGEWGFGDSGLGIKAFHQLRALRGSGKLLTHLSNNKNPTLKACLFHSPQRIGEDSGKKLT